MIFFDDHFLIDKKCVQIHYSLKNEILEKSFILNMESEEELAAAVIVYTLEKEKQKKKYEKRSTWVKPWLT